MITVPRATAPSASVRPRLAQILYTLLPCLFIGAAACSDSLGKETPQDDVATTAPGLYWDFGSVIEGSEIHYTFRFLATTAYEQGITSLKSSCGCLTKDILLHHAPESPSARYQLGQPIPTDVNVEVPVTLTTKGKSGQYRGSLLVLGPNDRLLQTLAIQGTIEPLFYIAPKILNLGIIRSSTGKQGSFRIHSTVLQPFSLRLIEPVDSSWVTASLSPDPVVSNGAALAWVLTVTLSPGLPPNPTFFSSVVLEATNLALSGPQSTALEPRQLNLLLQATITQDVYITPDYVSFGALHPGQVATTTVVVASHVPGTSLDPRIVIPPDFCTTFPDIDLGTTIGAFGDARAEIRITARCRVDAQSGPFRTEAEITSDSLSEPILLPIFGGSPAGLVEAWRGSAMRKPLENKPL